MTTVQYFEVDLFFWRGKSTVRNFPHPVSFDIHNVPLLQQFLFSLSIINLYKSTT